MPAISTAILALDAGLVTGGLSAGAGSALTSASAAAAVGAGVSSAASTASTVAGLGLQVKGARDASKAQEQADKLAQRKANLEARREKREQIRRSQIARAEIEANAITAGAQTSSAVAGGKAAVTNATNDNLLNIEQGQEFGRSAFGIRGRLNKANSLQNFGSALTQNAEVN